MSYLFEYSGNQARAFNHEMHEEHEEKIEHGSALKKKNKIWKRDIVKIADILV